MSTLEEAVEASFVGEADKAAVDGIRSSKDKEFPWRAGGSATLVPGRISVCTLFTLFAGSLRVVMSRRVIQLVVFAATFLVLGCLWNGLPPSFERIRDFYEERLPQHDLALPFPEGEEGMYLRFLHSQSGGSFSDGLQELLLMSHLAYLSNRSFVFEDHSLSTRLPYSIHNFALRPSRIPLNAFISGPTAGGRMPAPRAVSAEYWDFVCPPSVVRRFSPTEAPKIREGDALVDWWTGRLFDTTARCVEIDNRPPVFNRFLLGSNRVLSLWPSLVASPVLVDFAWSPLVMSGVERNLPLLTRAAPSFVPGIIEGLVAIHLPRGDYVQQCHQSLKWGKPYMGFNQFSGLPDRFEPPKFGSMKALGAREDYYMQHCWPKIDGVIEKLRDVRKENPRLKRVYVLTDDWSWWMNGLRRALAKDGWSDVKSSQDLQLSREQKYVRTEIDAAIAERADVFIGNGFSILSSNIVMLRTSRDMDPESSRFW